MRLSPRARWAEEWKWMEKKNGARESKQVRRRQWICGLFGLSIVGVSCFHFLLKQSGPHLSGQSVNLISVCVCIYDGVAKKGLRRSHFQIRKKIMIYLSARLSSSRLFNIVSSHANQRESVLKTTNFRECNDRLLRCLITVMDSVKVDDFGRFV